MIDLLRDLRERLKRKLCSHGPPVYQELRSEQGDNVFWTAYYECPKCKAVLQVVGSYYGEKGMLHDAIGERSD